MHYNFAKDNQSGKTGELFVRQIFLDHNIPVEFNIGPTKKELAKWDLRIIHSQEYLHLEVKYDLYAAKSGNIAIEYYNPKSCKPSGVAITEASLWVHVLTNPLQAWLTSTKKLLQYINDEKGRDVCGGDDLNSCMKLYRKDQILTDIFARIDGISREELLEIINEYHVVPNVSSGPA